MAFGAVLGVKQQELDDQLSNLVIVFEAFKHSHNLKAWLRFAPQRHGKKFLASYCIRSVIALWS